MNSASSGEPPVADLISVAQAIRIIDQTPVHPRIMRVPLLEAQGRRLAADLAADRDYPPFRKALMDGYAVRCADVGRVPVELACVAEIAAGQAPTRAVEAGEAIAIMTGAPLPAGADGVVPVEDVETRARTGQSVRVLRAPMPGRFIAQVGSDCAAGKTVLAAGIMMGPAQIAVAASVGAAEINVFARPRVAVLGTGDELVPIDQKPGEVSIRNSNNPMLLALLRRLSAEVTDLGFVRDDPEQIRQAIARGLEYDALFITGGMSMGEYDFVPKLLSEAGVELKITKLKIKPGKPFVFGVAQKGSGFRVQGSGKTEEDPVVRESSGKTEADSSLNPEPRTLNPPFVFGLPGNPVSAFICTIRLASRLLTRLAGGHVEERWLTGRMDVGLPANGPREFYQPAVRTMTPGSFSSRSEFASITPLAWKGSADLFTLAKANVLIVRAENEPAMPKGTVVRVLEM
ncbi:MAG TPA: molybdopterin molybdotransferase MoeA [Humisphaera sp.]|jgi:molybdopterin molybdotransferase|nr:molybdopterin molybdotransferase MoeA [Humisphaera sp.]